MDFSKYDSSVAEDIGRMERLLELDRRWWQTKKVRAEQRQIIDELNAYDEYMQPTLQEKIAKKLNDARKR